MKKAIVIYSTISGFTKRYAEWIAEELATKAVRLRDSDDSYDIIISGGNLHAVAILHHNMTHKLLLKGRIIKG